MTSESSVYAVLGPEPGAALAAAFLFVNLVGGAAICAVALLRLPARTAFGPGTAYHLWRLPPVVALAALVYFFVRLDEASGTLALAAPVPYLDLLASAWALGAASIATVFALAQARFMADVRAGRAGPAVVGLISPRIILPPTSANMSPARIRVRPPSPPSPSAPAGSTRSCTWPPTSSASTRSWRATPRSCGPGRPPGPSTATPC
jgi:hypothetical protein